MTEKIETVVIGAGQSGLSTSYYLTQNDKEHVVLEKNSELGSAWQKRWDSFTLVTPNFLLRLPDFHYDGENPDGFLSKDEVIQYIRNFAGLFDPPVRFEVEVNAVKQKGENDKYEVKTNKGIIQANNVIVATGTFQIPNIPEMSNNLPSDIKQMHSSEYRNPKQLPEGAVLVVGSGQSGCQIAEELYQSGRKVYLCVSNVERIPRRYRGKDFTKWIEMLGVTKRTIDDLPSPAARFKPNPHVSGKDGGHTLNLHQFARDGVTLLGHLENIDGSKIYLKDDLHDNLKKADKAAEEIKKGVDKLIENKGIDAPEAPKKDPLQVGFEQEVIKELDLKNEGIKTIIWATGYDNDFSWIKMPILDEYDYPKQERGVTQYPGLYFVGLHWMHTIESGLFAGVGKDAKHVIDHLLQRNS